jgi:glycosyltransferase involved in cell wall biosynthesis
VAPDQPNIREILVHDLTSLLFDPAVPGAMWTAVERLILDAPLRARLGQAARAELERQNYTWAGNASRLTGWAEFDFKTSQTSELPPVLEDSGATNPKAPAA